MALFRLGDDGEGLFAQTNGAEDFEDFLHVMAVDDFRAPTEGFEAALIDIHVPAEGGGLALTQAVDVHDGGQIVQLAHASERGGFPDRAFGDFAVTHQNIGAVIEIIEAGAELHAHAHAQTLAERAGGNIHKGQARRGMAFEVAVQFAQSGEVFAGKKSKLSPHGIQQRGGVALGKDEAVVVGISGVFRVEPHVPEEQGGDQVRRGTAGSGMAAAGRGGGGNGVNAQLIRNARQGFLNSRIHSLSQY